MRCCSMQTTPFSPAAALQRCAFLGGSSQIFSFRRPPFSKTHASSPRLIKVNGGLAAQAADTTAVNSRKDFPSDFIFGAGSSAFQVEGAPTEGGRGNTIWDSFIHIPGNVSDESLNYPGCDFYNLYEDDIKRVKDLGFDAFRFSISWTRIYPNGSAFGQESAQGIEFYNRLINAIIKAGLTPLVTLFHWETPQYLENDPGILGFRTKHIVPHFVNLAETCFKHFGDRVKIWGTINEMWVFARVGYGYGVHAPGRCSAVSGMVECAAGDSSTEPYQVGHNLLLAHAAVYQLYKNNYKEHQQGICGFNPCNYGVAPYSNKEEDILATQRHLEFNMGWQLDPVIFGDYPKSMRDALGHRLPEFNDEESEMLKNSSDFVGLNYYTAVFVEHADVPEDPSQRWFFNDGGYIEKYTNENGEYIGTQTGPSDDPSYSCPEHLPRLLEWMKDRYGNIPCYITENGVRDNTQYNSTDDVLDDPQRIAYIKGHLTHLSKAIKDKGINVKGYFYWSFMDVFEFNSGHEVRMGLFRVEFENGKPPTRRLKSSARWFKDFLTSSI